MDTRVVSVQFSLSLTRWRARGQHGAPPIYTIYRPGAILPRCMRARGIAHLLAAVCRIFARSAQNLAPAAREQKSKAIDAAADREVAAESVSTGDPAPTSAARSKQPSPTHAARPGSAKTVALDHNNISTRVGVPCRNSVPALGAISLSSGAWAVGELIGAVCKGHGRELCMSKGRKQAHGRLET